MDRGERCSDLGSEEKIMDGFYVYLSSDASEKLYPTNTKAKFTNVLGEPIEFDPHFEWHIALTEIMFPSTAQGKINTSTSVNNGPIFVYLDIIEPSRVGDSSSHVLRIVPPTASHQTFSDRYYIPTIANRVTQMTALLTNRLGEKYPFASGKEPVIIVLHFSPKPSGSI